MFMELVNKDYKRTINTAYKIAMISDIRMKIFYNLNGQKHEMQIDKYQLVSVEPLM